MFSAYEGKVTRPSQSLAVVGSDYPNRRGPPRRFELAMCSAGEAILLQPEPDNPADPHAVAVFSVRGIQIGYLTAERAPLIGRMIRQGEDVAAVFQGHTAYGATIRVAFGGELPVLPEPSSVRPSTAEADPFPEWLPDDIWPD